MMLTTEQRRELMIAAVREYYRTMEDINRPRQGLARLIQPVAAVLRRVTARQQLEGILRYQIAQMHTDEARRRLNTPQLNLQQAAVVRERIDKEYQYLNGFMKALDTMTVTQAVTRIGRYVTGVQNSGTRAEAATLPRLPVYPGDTRLDCKGYCRCKLQIVDLGMGNYDVYWIMNPEAEHCDSCLELSRLWSPLQIREGKIVNFKARTKRERQAVKRVQREIEA